MSSIQRSYAQRNTNSAQIIPEYNGILPEIDAPIFDLSGVAYYTLNLPLVQYTGGSFFVDLSGVDTNGNLLNLEGLLVAGDNSIYNVNFIVNVPFQASYAPNMEFTIYFKNIPFDRFGGPPILTIGILKGNNIGVPYPYILSPPAPQIFAPKIHQNVTFKSDGTDYTVVASGPAGWLGPYLINSLVASLSVIG
jgi:hypothetical protein